MLLNLYGLAAFFLPKLREKLDVQSRCVPDSWRCVPGSCCWVECQWTWCLHEPWVLATYSSCSGWIFFMPKLREKLDLQSRCVPGSCCWLNVNERFVCTSREFLQFIFLVLDGFFFTPKLKEKLDLQSRYVPGSCVLRKILLYFCAFLTFSFGYVKIVLWKYCLLMWWDFVLVWEEL